MAVRCIYFLTRYRWEFGLEPIRTNNESNYTHKIGYAVNLKNNYAVMD
jgi:hypothetical protein